MKSITIQTAKNDLDNLIDRAQTNPEPTIIQNTNGQQAVLISLNEFNALQATIQSLSNSTDNNHIPHPAHNIEAQVTVEVDATLHHKNDCLEVEPPEPQSLLAYFATLDDLDEEFPDVDEGLLPLDDIVI